MAKKVLLVVFTIECVVLAVLLCREWTRYYIGGGQSAADYETVYRDKLEAGHHPITADIDAGTTSFVFWWAARSAFSSALRSADRGGRICNSGRTTRFSPSSQWRRLG